MQKEVENIEIDENIREYIINLVEATRKNDENISI